MRDLTQNKQGATTSYVPRAISLVLPAAVQDDWESHLEAVDSAVEWARSQPGVDPDRIFVAGFCFGGGVAVRYSAWKPEKVAACGVFYGKPVSQGTGLPPLYAGARHSNTGDSIYEYHHYVHKRACR